MKAEQIRGLSHLGDEAQSVGRQIANLLRRVDELAVQATARSRDAAELEETLTEARRFIGGEIIHGIGPANTGAFRKGIER